MLFLNLIIFILIIYIILAFTCRYNIFNRELFSNVKTKIIDKFNNIFSKKNDSIKLEHAVEPLVEQKIEEYTPIITRPLDLNKKQENPPPDKPCDLPFTNNKKDIPANKNVSVFQYADRMIMNPEQYLNMVRLLLNDLSTITKEKFLEIYNNENLEVKDYLGDQNIINEFIKSKIDILTKENTYLQQNGNWVYEYFNILDTNINFYKVKTKENTFLFKIVFTLGNPLRSSYTSCIGFILLENNIELSILYTTLFNEFDYNEPDDKLEILPDNNLDFSFLDTLALSDFDQWSNTKEYSGLNYINEPRIGTKIDIKAEIPPEFNDTDKFVPQYLPPLRGNGIAKYPPYYKTNDGSVKYFNTPPI